MKKYGKVKEHTITPSFARFKPVKEHTVTPRPKGSKPVKEHTLIPRTFTKNGQQKGKEDQTLKVTY